MTINVTDYSTSDAIRGAIGYDSKDIPDDAFTQMDLERALTVDLDNCFPTHATIFADGTQGTPTTEQVYQKDLLMLYTQWTGGWEIAKKRLIAIQMFSDGKAEMRRFDDLDWEALIDMAATQRSKYKDLLQLELGESDTPSSYSPLGLALPAYDPVEGV